MRALPGHDSGSDVGHAADQARTRPYRVGELADELDVSDQTLYRDIEAGLLRARRHGRGRGTLRIPVAAVDDYVAELESRAATRAADVFTAASAVAS